MWRLFSNQRMGNKSNNARAAGELGTIRGLLNNTLRALTGLEVISL